MKGESEVYQFVSRSERNQLVEACEDIILKVQKSVKEYFTFEFRLIGSGERKLITQNGIGGPFDLDYNFLLHRDKQELSSNPDKIKEIFMQAFNSVNPEYGFKYANDSTSVITSKLVFNGKLEFSFDIAILVEGNNGNLYKLIYDKSTGRYLWNEIKQTKDYSAKFQNIKATGRWDDFKDRYLDLKNYHLSRQDGIKSFSTFLETLNEFKAV